MTPDHTRGSLSPQMARSLRAQAQALEEIEGRFGTLAATPARLAQRQNGNLLGVEWNGRLVIPGFQLDEHGQVRSVMADVIALGAEHGYDEMSLLIFLCSPSTYVERDAAPVTLIDEPDRLLKVVQEALGVAW